MRHITVITQTNQLGGRKLVGISLFIFLLVAISCSDQLSDPQQIVDLCIKAHGGEKYSSSTIEFDFRGRHYVAVTDGGKFSHQRILKDSISTTHDFLSNDGFIREIDTVRQALPDSMVAKYISSVNSVIYFAQLPFRLNDPSVNKRYLGTTTLEGEPYYKIEITFGSEGGEGNRDTFYYWIHQKTFMMDYLAYYYLEGKEWEFRFRKVLNRKTVNGIVLQDYINYKSTDSKAPFNDVEQLYATGKLTELSRILLENPIVK